jgi:Flp pilus assembly protein TadG
MHAQEHRMPLSHRRVGVAGRRRDRGAVAVEMTMLVWPVAVIMAAFIAGAWVLSVARHDVNAATAAAARAASQQHDPQSATATATQTAQAALAESGRACTTLTVTVDTSAFTHGGHVDVNVACTIDLGGLVGIEVPGSLTFQATARAPIETFRELGTPP